MSKKVKERRTDTKKAKLESEYKKARRNLQRRVRAQAKRGYTGYKLPKAPKRVTEASIARLNKIGAKEIKKQSRVNVFGRTVKATSKMAHDYEKAQRSESALRGWRTRRDKAEKQRLNDIQLASESRRRAEQEVNELEESVSHEYVEEWELVLNNFESMVSGLKERANNDWAVEQLLDIYNSEVLSQGEKALAKNIQKNAERINKDIDIIAYASDRDTVFVTLVDILELLEDDHVTEAELRQFEEGLEDTTWNEEEMDELMEDQGWYFNE